MSDLESKSSSFLNSWLSMDQFCQQKKANFPRITETSGPLAIAINLSYIPVQSIHELFQTKPEEIKEHKGVRTTFFIVKMLYPGWSSVKSVDGKKQINEKTSNSNNKRKDSTEPKEKLSTMYGEHVAMHSFDLINQRGTYIRSGKSEECLVLSPGMLLTTKVWGNKFDKTFKEQTTDINVFDFVIVQFGMHSMQSSSKENGMMLEIKSYNKMCQLNASSFHMLPSTLIPNNMQEASILRTKFTDASHISEPIHGLSQNMLKGNISTSCFLVRFLPNQQNGVFAIGPDESIKYYVQHPCVDIPNAGNINILYQPSDFIYNCDSTEGYSLGNKEWTVKLFNILQLVNVLEMLIVIDTYKKDKAQNDDDGVSNLILDAYVRINVNAFIQKIQMSSPINGASIQFIANAFVSQPSTLKNLVCYPLLENSQVHIVIDMRKMISKKDSKSSSPLNTSTSIVCPDSHWDRGHSVYIFYEERLVHYMVIPLSPAAAGSDNTKLVLDTVNIAQFSFETCDFEPDTCIENGDSTSDACAETVKSKKSKKM